MFDVTDQSTFRSILNSVIAANGANAGADDVACRGATSGVASVALDHSLIRDLILAPGVVGVLSDPSSTGWLSGSFSPGWVSPISRNFRLAPGSICINRGNDNIIGLDLPDCDGDLNISERSPRSFVPVGGVAYARELPDGVAPTGPFIGVDDPLISGIVDIGAHEFLDVQADTPSAQ